MIASAVIAQGLTIVPGRLVGLLGLVPLALGVRGLVLTVRARRDEKTASTTVAVFAVLTTVWCVAGSWLGSHKRAIAWLQRYGHWMVPVVFIAVGVAVIVRSGIVG